MPINPIAGAPSPGSLAGVAVKLADLDRRLRGVEAVRTQIGANAIQGGNIGPNQVDGTHISPSSISTAHIQAGSIDASTINAISIAAAVGSFVNINAGQITAGSIATAQLTANVLAAVQASVTTLSAITSNMGSITAGTISGGTFKTPDNRLILDSTGIKGYLPDGVTKVFEMNTGTGLVTVTGVIIANANSVVPTTTLSGFIGGGNLLADSSFESTDPTWPTGFISIPSARVTAVKSTTQKFHGANSLAVTYATGTDPYANVVVDASNQAAVKGKPVVFSAWVYVPSSVGTLVAGTTDRALLIYDGTTSRSVPLTTVPRDTWTRLTVKLNVAAAGTLDLRLYNIFDTGTVYYDGVQLEIGDAATAYAPKPDEIIYGSIRSLQIGAGEVKANNVEAGAINAGHITVAFGGPNRLVNPGMENNTPTLDTNATIPGWSSANTNTQRTAAQVNTGSTSARVTVVAAAAASFSTAPATAPLVTPGQKYTASLYVRSNVGTPQTQVRLQFYDASNAVIGSVAAGTLTTPTSTWQRLSVSGTPVAGAVYARVYAYMPTPAAADSIFVDNAQLEIGGEASPWGPNPNEILPGSVGNTQIAPDAITTDKILTGSITSGLIDVGGLTAISILSSSITGGTITGANFQTTASAGVPKAIMDASGFRYLNSAGTALFSATAGTVSIRGAITAETMNFVNIGSSYGGTNSLNFYSGNFASLGGYISVYQPTADLTVRDDTVQTTSATGVAEIRLTAKSVSENVSSKLVLQSRAGGVDSLRYFWTSGAGTDFLKFGVDENGDTTIAGHIYTHPGTAGAQNWWWTGNPFMRIYEYWGLRISGGNYTTNTYGGGGMAHVVLAASGDTTTGIAYSLGYSYALVHVDYSDAKIKHSVRDVDDAAALSRVRALRPRQWAFKGGSGTGNQERGFIAQEVAEVIPDAVERLIDADGNVSLGFKPTALIASLVSAVQELSETVNILRGEAPEARLARDNVKPLKIK